MEKHERFIQRQVHRLLSDPSVIYKTSRGKRLQILSPGSLNDFHGPDFLDISVLLNGTIVVGDAEFHRRCSDWELHGHSSNKRYDNVILHVVFENDTVLPLFHETLVVSEKEAGTQFIGKNELADSDYYRSFEDIQHYALLRILRLSSEAQKLLNSSSIEKVYFELARSFLEKYSNRRRRRHVYSKVQISELIKSILESKSMELLKNLKSREKFSVLDAIQEAIKTKIAGEGPALRLEIILNCMLPVAICISDEEARINLFLWYWSSPALNRYGILAKRFDGFPQNYLWQQQGMLEYLYQHGSKPNVCKEMLTEYAFAEVLSFYKIAGAYFEELK